jgi:hypothetical protein
VDGDVLPGGVDMGRGFESVRMEGRMFLPGGCDYGFWVIGSYSISK